MDAEVIHCGAEEDGRLGAGVDLGFVVFDARHVEHFEFFDGSGIVIGVEFFANFGIFERANGDWRTISALWSAFKEMDLLLLTIIDATETGARTEGPIDGESPDAEDAFEFIEEGEGIAGWAIAFVHKSEDGDAASSADFEEFSGLRFDAFGGIDHHDHGIDGGEDAVSVFGKVFVAWGVEEIDAVASVVELEDGGGDGDAALAFEFHPIGSGLAGIFSGGDRTRELDGATVEEEFFGESGFAGIGVRDDSESATALDFCEHERSGLSWKASQGASACAFGEGEKFFWGVCLEGREESVHLLGPWRQSSLVIVILIWILFVLRWRMRN